MFDNLAELNDLQVAFVLSHFLASEKILHVDIRRMYEKDELKYDRLCDTVQMDFNAIYRKYPYEKAMQMQMCFGLCYDSVINQQFHQLYPMIRKAYKFSWNYVETYRSFDGQVFLGKWMKKYPADYYPLQVLLKMYSIAVVLSEMKGYPVIRYDEIMIQKVIQYINDIWSQAFDISLPSLEGMDIQTESEEINEVLQYISNPKNLLENFRDLFLKEMQQLKLSHQIIGKCYCEACIKTKEDQAQAERLLYEKVIRQGSAQWLKVFDFLFHLLDMDAPSFTVNVKIHSQQLRYFIRFLEEAHESYNLSEKMYLPCLFFYLYMIALYKDYQNVRNLLYKNPKQSVYLLEMEKSKNREAELLRKNEQFKRKYQMLQKENERLRQLLAEANKKEQRIQREMHQQLKARLDFSEEVYALRAYIIGLDQDERCSVSVSEEKQIQALKKIRIAVIGGAYDWHKKLKTILPETVFFYADHYLKQYATLRSCKYVFINTKILSHKSYDKLMEIIEKNYLPFFYLKGHRNISLTISEMYSFIFPEKNQ